MAEKLKPHWFYILLALAEGPRHGSAIAEAALAQSGGRVRLWPTTLYGSLDELVEGGWIESLDGRSHPKGESGRRRYYRLTARGWAALRDESAFLRSVADVALARLHAARQGTG